MPSSRATLSSFSGAKFAHVLDPARLEGRTWDNAGRVEDVATGSAAGPAATIEVRPAPDGRLWVGGPVAPVAAGRFQAQLT